MPFSGLVSRMQQSLRELEQLSGRMTRKGAAAGPGDGQEPGTLTKRQQDLLRYFHSTPTERARVHISELVYDGDISELVRRRLAFWMPTFDVYLTATTSALAQMGLSSMSRTELAARDAVDQVFRKTEDSEVLAGIEGVVRRARKNGYRIAADGSVTPPKKRKAVRR